MPATALGPPTPGLHAISLITPADKLRQRLLETRVRFKRLSPAELRTYIASGQWRGKAGAYALDGLAGAFVVKLVGSQSAVLGLPVYETVALLEGAGFPVGRELEEARM